MNKLLCFVSICFILFLPIYTYADNDYQSPLLMAADQDDEDIEGTETDETSEYNIDIKPYVNVRYTSTKSVIDKK